MDQRWKVPKKKKAKIKPRDSVEMCRVLPTRLANIKGSVDWLRKYPRTKLGENISHDLNNLYKQLAELVKDSEIK
ncbi:hypothetical protein P13BB106kb_p085 [Pectobacterium phage DU_PP_V]|uniref:Uncharacterized protein n=1 Tax=Pectobacterium phage DU_PP_V TaxID=2041492 RepID=A0A2D2W6Z7_9CAUD|nr:hypothetical protein HOS40_gp084 [Pectobacterium phage DU_PP_V]ATS94069.1 hypothetical protein P13BB106kb_p085 [Pectobacterium phage DU_PP_V]